MNHERQPLYIQIQEHFKSLIVSGQLMEDAKIPPETELMGQFDVSRITVANALAQLAKQGWVYRIPGRGSFVSKGALKRINGDQTPSTPSSDNVAQPTLSVPRRSMIGLLIPYVADYFAIRLIQGMTKLLEKSGFYLTIVLTHNSKEREKEAISELIDKGAVGLIIFPADAENYNEDILNLKMKRYPFVLVDRYFPGVETDCVCSDGVAGAQLAVDYLWELGHRHIAICSDSPLPTLTVEERVTGYMNALKRKGVLINPSLILTECDVACGSLHEAHWLYSFLQERKVSAFITLNAKLGLHIASMANQLKLKVPQDISILTYDDPFPGIDKFGAFTFIAQSEEEMGSEAVRILLERLEAPLAPGTPYRKVVLQPRIVAGQTTARARSSQSERAHEFNQQSIL